MVADVARRMNRRLIPLAVAVMAAATLASVAAYGTARPAHAPPVATGRTIVCPLASPQPCPPPCVMSAARAGLQPGVCPPCPQAGLIVCPPPCEASASALCPPPCGTSATPICPPPPPPPPPPCTRRCGRVVVTQADAGRTISLKRGSTLVVRLNGTPQFFWSAPQTSNSAALASQGSSADPTTGDALGQFTAAGAGQAEVRAMQQPLCALKTPPCLTPDRLFVLTVNVN